MKYALIYTWKGGRYRALTQGPIEVMAPLLESFHKDGWNAWLEELA